MNKIIFLILLVFFIGCAKKQLVWDHPDPARLNHFYADSTQCQYESNIYSGPPPFGQGFNSAIFYMAWKDRLFNDCMAVRGYFLREVPR